MPDQVVGRMDVAPIDRQDDVARAELGFIGGTARVHLGHGHAVAGPAVDLNSQAGLSILPFGQPQAGGEGGLGVFEFVGIAALSAGLLPGSDVGGRPAIGACRTPASAPLLLDLELPHQVLERRLVVPDAVQLVVDDFLQLGRGIAPEHGHVGAHRVVKHFLLADEGPVEIQPLALAQLTLGHARFSLAISWDNFFQSKPAEWSWPECSA